MLKSLTLFNVKLTKPLSGSEFWYLLRTVAKASPCDAFYFTKIDFPYADTLGRLVFGTPKWASVIRLRIETPVEISIEKDIRYRMVEKQFDGVIRVLLRCALEKLKNDGIVEDFTEEI